MDTNKRSPTPEHHPPEDPETAAARKELKQTVISEHHHSSSTMSTAKADPAPKAASSGDKASTKNPTSDRGSVEPQNDDLKDQVSSPKKKRARDELDESREAPSDANGDVSPIGADGRNDESEPEKKRPRDSSQSKAKSDAPTTTSESKFSKSTDPKPDSKSDKQTSEKQATTIKDNVAADKDKKGATSTSAFNSSGIAGFATQASPFLQAGTKPLSSFASPSTSKSPFGAPAATTSSTTTVFGGSSLSNGASPFGQVGGAPKPFGSAVFGGTFGSKIGSPSLTSFGKPGESFKSNKPAKPFGAPASEEEDDGEEGNSDNEEKADNEEEEAQEEKSVAADDKKKQTKLQRVVVDDGEAGEATILQVRAKIYHLDKASSSWKERGAGNLKINVPASCIDFDEDTGAPVPGSFDVSALEDAQSKVVRLVMRQDSTHRVILNTVIIPAMQFQEKSMVKATCVLFTAIEDDGAVSIQLKMNEANAKSFINEVGKIQRELQSV
ncbi:uncharacterized protein F4822DRAFT_34676 [Hypoxylon trugodes]|uniref:uncharacterized protein n=1 Tax=Hypoxylon trugodes TaxID=326681 RepID=UPI00219B9469|nr:uncharacterized protein F4822DRAFT_34676 [Hypoxylon trugodes]KAI1394044.1 hypothetical protein F4822DRAFT_34676 [Hypoxylon trugodes]